MSASEKLKALDDAATSGPWLFEAGEGVQYVSDATGRFDAHIRYEAEDAALVAALRNVLPQIVAVVEAAEKAVKDEQYGIQRTPIPAALAALEEALK